ncbi:acyltransferase family protein [Pseudonocardia sp. EC080625-04]|uniref:acyltransferase family protein n=1 Tax=Pseudonocardia sp. EC080625-04 TaxID=1096868 RepID=UPI000761D3EC|nr:acyltransferase family protein [Pseudonocardia sp. EC080625-04]
MTSPGGAGPARTETATRSRFRPELQGLRALAVVLVVVYHVWVGPVSGGVDVFFLITGFLIVGGLYRAGLRGGVDVLATWKRQLSRLLPAITVVLAAGIAAGAFLLPESRWSPTVRETVASLLFVQNWELAANAVDYAARSDAASIVQHFWSLSIQGQFYLVAPLLVAGVVIASQRDRADLHTRLTGTLLVVGGASLAYSVYLTVVNQPLAYFHSLTRVWEFALGGLLALWISRIEGRPELTAGARMALGWLGVLALVSCGVLLQVDRAFPGWAALWPTVAAALVIVAGRSGHPLGADRLLAGPLLRSIGDLSFPLYLWHWPILVLALVYTGDERLSLGAGAVVIGVSFVLAWLTHRFVERPIAALDVRHSLRTGLALALVVLVGAAGWFGVATARASVQVEAGSPTHPGAAALAPGFEYAGLADTDPATAPAAEVDLAPSLVGAPDDWSYHRGTWDCGPLQRDGVEMQFCTIPPPGDAPPERRIVVIGDSHIQQYVASLMPVAAQRHWEIIGMFRGACPFSTGSETDPADEGCTAFNAAAAAETAELRPDALLTLATRDVRPGLTESTPHGFVDAWWRMHDAGVPVVAVRDNPRPPFFVPECISTQGRHAEGCALDRHDVYPTLPPYAALPDVPPNVSFIDTAPAICEQDRCPAEIGNVLVYMDDNHLTATYAETMAPVFADHFESRLGW